MFIRECVCVVLCLFGLVFVWISICLVGYMCGLFLSLYGCDVWAMICEDVFRGMMREYVICVWLWRVRVVCDFRLWIGVSVRMWCIRSFVVWVLDDFGCDVWRWLKWAFGFWDYVSELEFGLRINVKWVWVCNWIEALTCMSVFLFWGFCF